MLAVLFSLLVRLSWERGCSDGGNPIGQLEMSTGSGLLPPRALPKGSTPPKQINLIGWRHGRKKKIDFLFLQLESHMERILSQLPSKKEFRVRALTATKIRIDYIDANRHLKELDREKFEKRLLGAKISAKLYFLALSAHMQQGLPLLEDDLAGILAATREGTFTQEEKRVKLLAKEWYTYYVERFSVSYQIFQLGEQICNEFKTDADLLLTKLKEIEAEMKYEYIEDVQGNNVYEFKGRLLWFKEYYADLASRANKLIDALEDDPAIMALLKAAIEQLRIKNYTARNSFREQTPLYLSKIEKFYTDLLLASEMVSLCTIRTGRQSAADALGECCALVLDLIGVYSGSNWSHLDGLARNETIADARFAVGFIRATNKYSIPFTLKLPEDCRPEGEVLQNSVDRYKRFRENFPGSFYTFCYDTTARLRDNLDELRLIRDQISGDRETLLEAKKYFDSVPSAGLEKLLKGKALLLGDAIAGCDKGLAICKGSEAVFQNWARQLWDLNFGMIKVSEQLAVTEIDRMQHRLQKLKDV